MPGKSYPQYARGSHPRKVRARRIFGTGHPAMQKCSACEEMVIDCVIASGYSRCAFCTAKGHTSQMCGVAEVMGSQPMVEGCQHIEEEADRDDEERQEHADAPDVIYSSPAKAPTGSPSLKNAEQGTKRPREDSGSPTSYRSIRLPTPQVYGSSTPIAPVTEANEIKPELEAIGQSIKALNERMGAFQSELRELRGVNDSETDNQIDPLFEGTFKTKGTMIWTVSVKKPHRAT